MLNKYGRDALSGAAMPLEGPEADRTLPAIPAVSASATAVEAAFHSDGSIYILPFTRLSLPFSPLVPTPLASPFRAVARRNLRAWPSDSRTNTSTGTRPRLAHIPLAGGQPACADRTHPKAAAGGQPCPRLVRLSEVRSGPLARGSLSYGTGRTGNLTE